MLQFAPGVVSKQYRDCTQAELTAAYKELFGIIPCAKCNGIDWSGVHKSIINQYNKLSKITKMQSGKYIWNPVHGKVRTFINGRPVDSSSTDQTILEKIYNDPKRAGLVIINPEFKEKKTKEVEPAGLGVVYNNEPYAKQLAKQMFSEGKSKTAIKKELGISAEELKEYLK